MGVCMAKADLWPKLLPLVAGDDGMPVRECGPWTEDKLYFWSKRLFQNVSIGR